MTTTEKLDLATKALQQVQEDINWMLNSGKLLTPDVFNYLHEAVDALAD